MSETEIFPPEIDTLIPVALKKGFDRSNARIADEEQIEKNKLRPGRGHKVTDASRLEVMLMSFFGYTQQQMADYYGFKDPKSIRDHYGECLVVAETFVDVEVFKAWLKNVQDGKEATILRYLEAKFNRMHNVPPPAAQPERKALNKENIRKLIEEVENEF